MAADFPSSAKRAGKGLDKHWHLATDEFEVGVTELEFSIFRVSAAFERWQGDCLGCCLGQAFSGTDTALLHVIRMHERPKSISELARLLKRDDVSNLQYGTRKLLKAGLIEKSRRAGSKKDVTYQVSALGRDITNRYARFRRELLISMTRSTAGKVDFESVARALTLMSAMYDQASCIAATHRVPL
ncbi:MAG TPA: winged helix DNA-binding protein [Steroidobacteraceae bacterium]